MNTLYIAVLLLSDIMVFMIIIDVILSWLPLLGLHFRPRLISELLDPLYNGIQKYIPTTFGPFMFTPIILLFFIYLVRGIIIIMSPGIIDQYQTLLNIF